MKILYALPTRLFFEEGACGRVAHAKGFCSGVVGNGGFVTLLAGQGVEDFRFPNQVEYKKVCANKFLWYFLFFVKLLFISKKHDVCVVRWRPFLPFVLVSMGFFGHKVWLEVNTVTGLESKVALVRFFVRLSVFISARFFKIIVVSEKSARLIDSLARKEGACEVVRNGFISDAFHNFKPLSTGAQKFNLVYFGRKQSYYDWDMLYEAVSRVNNSFALNLHVFGFSEEIDIDNVFFHGEFGQEELVLSLSELENPILVLHADASDVARAGSPMKMFEYAATGIPCIVSDSLTEQSRDFHGFSYYSAGDKNNFIELLFNIKADYSKELDLAAESRALALKSYTWVATVKEWYERI